MQAIRTKFFGPTNSRGSRIKATAFSGSVTVSYRHELNSQDNHVHAAKVLQHKFNWNFELHSGELADHSYVHVQE